MTESTRRIFRHWPLFVALLTVLADQVSKFYIVRALGPEAARHTIPLIGSFARLAYVENTGISFGRLQGHSSVLAVGTAFLVVALLVAYRWLLTPNHWANLAVGFILGGAVGNLTDRILTSLRYGLDRSYVVDFVSLGSFPVFNVADSAITVGGILYGVYLVFFREMDEQEGRGDVEDGLVSPGEQNAEHLECHVPPGQGHLSEP